MSIKKKEIKPPRLGKWLLESFCSYDFQSTALWDLEELFRINVKTKGIRRAKLIYLIEALGIVIHLFFKGKSQYSINNIAMFKHNILISFRSFKRFKSTFFINLIGLATGLASTLLIYLWVSDELSMDRFHENEPNLYQVLQNAETSAGIMTFQWTPALLGSTLMERYPEVEFGTTVLPHDHFDGFSYAISNNNYFQVNEQFVDEYFFEIFSFPMQFGDQNTIFTQPSGVLISQELATKLFGSVDAMGQTIKFQNEAIDKEYIVVGVFKNVPGNSTLQFDMLFNMQEYLDTEGADFLRWNSNNPLTFVTLNAGVDLEQFNQSIYGLVETFEPRAQSKVFAQKFSERYLNGNYEEGKIVGGRIAYVRLFSLVGLVVLVIACINFMNLSTAKANTRLKELGVKKALGALRGSLIQQYFTEALLLTVLASILSLVLVTAVLPFFNLLTGKSLELTFTPNLIMGIFAIVLITTVLSGSYPALYLSRLKAIASLKGKIAGSFGDIWARKGLVIFQFSASIILIVSVLIITNQIDYIHTKNLGYNRDNLLYFSNSGIDEDDFQTLLNQIKGIPGVLNAAGAAHDLTGDFGRTGGVSWPGKEPNERLSFLNLETGVGFIETMGIELVEGRSIEPDRPNEFNKIILNETAVRKMRLENPVGMTIKLWGRDKQIVGIVKDFNVETLYEEISPTMIHPVTDDLTQTFVKVQAGTEAETIRRLEETFLDLSHGSPFHFGFVDSAYQAMYEGEKQVASLAKSFALVAIIISCLGLLGLTSFTAERRSKEIGIRKVLGSGVWRIVYLLSSDFTRMVIGALIIGLPISYFIAREWIQNFAFGIELSLSHFLFAGLIILIISWLTVGFQTVKSARANPVDSLRNE